MFVIKSTQNKSYALTEKDKTRKFKTCNCWSI